MNATVQTERKSHVVVVEDHPVLREGLKQLIDSQPDLSCVAVADNTSDAKRLAEQCKADLMLLDLRLKTGDALDLVKSLRVEHSELNELFVPAWAIHPAGSQPPAVPLAGRRRPTEESLQPLFTGTQPIPHPVPAAEAVRSAIRPDRNRHEPVRAVPGTPKQQPQDQQDEIHRSSAAG
jgi:CheY-like chemotaxis protein